MRYDVCVLEIVSDGPNGYPDDGVADIGICGVDLDMGEVDSLYSMFVSREGALTDDKRAYLSAGGISADDLKMGSPIGSVCADVKKLLNGKSVASFDVKNVFYGYMVNEPWDLTKEVHVMPSICSRLPRSMTMEPRYENTAIRNAYRRIFADDPMSVGDGKRALDHALMASAILMELRKKGRY